MESDSEMVALPLLPTPIESNYRACTIPYRFPSDNPRKATPTEISWIDLFSNSIPSFKFASLSRDSVLHFMFKLWFLWSRKLIYLWNYSDFGFYPSIRSICSILVLRLLWLFMNLGFVTSWRNSDCLLTFIGNNRNSDPTNLKIQTFNVLKLFCLIFFAGNVQRAIQPFQMLLFELKSLPKGIFFFFCVLTCVFIVA